jgi:hypothetical protein
MQQHDVRGKGELLQSSLTLRHLGDNIDIAMHLEGSREHVHPGGITIYDHHADHAHDIPSLGL